MGNIEKEVIQYTTKDALNYDNIQTLSLVKSACYITLALFNKSISGFEVTFISLNLYRAVKKPGYNSELHSINTNNYSTTIPRLQHKLEKKRKLKGWVNTLSGFWLGYLVASKQIDEKNESILSQVSSDLISSGVIHFVHKTPDEKFLDQLNLNLQHN
ncbi:hypothetical protein DID78_05980 [Candidatus Marinamargulisbacteria bacterium SCGC AG-343-D04]|nr:hypothetical protein DID78_05980 [Candidatus Marinamargulisbacteria bacterium SCGC AG-343-D04]